MGLRHEGGPALPGRGAFGLVGFLAGTYGFEQSAPADNAWNA